MSTHITANAMTSDTTGHTARRDPRTGRWHVTWLPDRLLDRDQAITAMTLAEHVAIGAASATHREWPHVCDWAAELGLSPDNAVFMIKERT